MHQITVVSGPTEVSTCFGSLHPFQGLKPIMANALGVLEGKMFCSIGGRSLEEDDEGVLAVVQGLQDSQQEEEISCHGTPKGKLVKYKRYPRKASGKKGAVDCVSEEELKPQKKRGDLAHISEHFQADEVRSSSVNISTTLKTILVAALLTSALVNGDPHIDNRPGKGDYARDASRSGNNCSPLKYGAACKAWTYQKDVSTYPFFNTFPYKYSLIEALSEGFIQMDEQNTCKLTTTSPVTSESCLKSLRGIKHTCPPGFRSALFAHSTGKVRGIICDNQYQVTPDCKFCQSTENNAKVKNEIVIQDIVCQQNGTEYNGPIIKIPGYCDIEDVKYRDCSDKDVSFEKVAFALMKNKKLYLPSMVLKYIDTVSADHFRCFRHKKAHGVTGSNTDVTDYVRVKPRECKQLDSSKTTKCTGDEVFCSYYNCDKERSDAFCFHANGSGIIHVQYGGSWLQPSCVGFETVMVTKPRLSLPLSANLNCPSCVAKCHQNSLEINSNGFLITSAIACSHGECKTKTQKPRHSIIMQKPSSLKISGGEVGVHLSTEGEEPSYKLSIHCDPINQCDAYSCTFCWENVLNFHCHTLISSFVLALMIGSVASCALAMMVKISKGTKSVILKSRNPVLWVIKLVKWLWLQIWKALNKGMTTLSRKINDQTDLEVGSNQSFKNGIPLREVVVQKRTGGTRIKPVNYYLYGSTIVLGLITGSFSCTENLIASSKISSCFIESGRHVCKLSGVVNLRVGTIGSESCLIVKGPLDGQTQALKIRTKSSELVCQEGQSFWTNHFTPKCYSSRRCHLVGECQASNCLEWNASNVSQEFRSQYEPGMIVENVCFEQCGGIGCSCFNVNPSCLFGMTILKPTYDKAIKVFQCASWTHRITLEFEGPGITAKQVSLTSMSTQVAEWGSITLSVDADSTIDNPNISFLKTREGEYALIEESITTSPQKGRLGEIRCQTEQQAASGSPSCLRADKLVDYRPQYDTLECISKLIDPRAILKRNGLPQSRGKYLYTPSLGSDTVQAVSRNTIEATMTLTLDNYEVSFLSEKTECLASFVNISGCYSCHSGASICFKVTSKTPASIYIRDERETKIISKSITAGEKAICSVLHYSKPIVDEIFEYTCGSEWKKIQVHGSLILLSLIDDHKEGGSTIVVGPSSSSFSVGDWTTGLLSWFGGPIKTLTLLIIYVVATIIVIALVVALIKLALKTMIFKKNV
nr:glycoprotein [Arumowot virus]